MPGQTGMSLKSMDHAAVLSPLPVTVWQARFGINTQTFLQQVTRRNTDEFSKIPDELSFNDYLEKEVSKHPQQHLRNTSQYVADAMAHAVVGTRMERGEERQLFELPKANWFPSNLHVPGAVGQHTVLNQFYAELRGFQTQRSPDRMFWFHGPNGSGKGTLVDMIQRMVEAYSKYPSGKGVRYTLDWHLTPSEKK
jgi:hypothetical protein